MSTMTVDVKEAQTQLSGLLPLVLQGDEVVITENQQPLVQLVPIRKRLQRRIAGLYRGAMRMRNDFNEPMPDAFWLGDK